MIFTGADIDASKKIRRAKVTFSYAADGMDELTLEPGQVYPHVLAGSSVHRPTLGKTNTCRLACIQHWTLLSANSVLPMSVRWCRSEPSVRCITEGD